MDQIQRVLVEAGRKDLAQEYYKKVASESDEAKKELAKLAYSIFSDCEQFYRKTGISLTDYQAKNINNIFADALHAGISKEKFDVPKAIAVFNKAL